MRGFPALVSIIQHIFIFQRVRILPGGFPSSFLQLAFTRLDMMRRYKWCVSPVVVLVSRLVGTRVGIMRLGIYVG